MWDKIVNLCEEVDKIILIERNPKEIYLSMLNHFDKPPFLKNIKIYYDLKNYLREIENFKLENSKYLSIQHDDLIFNQKDIDMKLQNYLNVKDIKGLGRLSDYKCEKTHGDKTARRSKSILKLQRNRSKLSIKIANCLFENRISLTAWFLMLIGYIALIINGRTKKKGTQIYY